LVQEPAIREHRSGQRIVNRLVERLVERGRVHLASDRLVEAQADCRQAAQLAKDHLDVIHLQEEIWQRASGQQAAQARRHQMVQQAQARIDQGQLSVGLELCQKLGEDDSLRARLAGQVADRRAEFQDHLERARRLLGESQYAQVVQEVVSLTRLRPRDAQVDQLATQLLRTVCDKARQELVAGRLDRCDGYLQLLEGLQPESADYQDLRRLLQACHAVVAGLPAAGVQAAARQLRLLGQQLPDVPWIAQAAKEAEGAARAIDALVTGPLGLIDRPVDSVELPAVRQRVGRPPVQDVLDAPLPASASDRFVLHVAGAGSALVLRQPTVCMASAYSSRPPDLPLVGPTDLPRVFLERSDDDYFLRAESPVAVNGQTVTSKLLADGDVLEPGRRMRMEFSLPCPASTSAVLRLAGARLPRSDTRQVILMGDSILLSADRQAHLLVPAAMEPLVVYFRQSTPMLRSGQHSVPLRWGASCELQGVHVTLTPLPPGSGTERHRA
jgi:hypothetical protein